MNLPSRQGKVSSWRMLAILMILTSAVACQAEPGESFVRLRISGYTDGGETIIFAGCPKGQRLHDLFSMTREGGDCRALTSSHRYTETAHVHAATGEIACIEIPRAGGFKLLVLNRYGKVVRRLEPPRGLLLAGFPTWSPDGGYLSCLGTDLRRDLGKGIYVIQREGEGLRRLSPRTLQFLARTWYPDGRAVLCAFKGEQALWRVRLDRVAEALPDLGEVVPEVQDLAFSPDGEKVAVADSSDSRRLRVIDMRGGRELQVDIGSSLLAWGPNGCRLFYGKRVDGYEQIFVFDLKSGDRKCLTEGRVTSFDYLYTPKEEVFFVRLGEAGASLWRMRPDGTDQKCLVSGPPPRKARAPK